MECESEEWQWEEGRLKEEGGWEGNGVIEGEMEECGKERITKE
jgi:hypothetical protein